MNDKSGDRHRDHYLVHPIGRKLSESIIGAEQMEMIDEAKQDLADMAGVRVEHLQLQIEMLVRAEV